MIVILVRHGRALRGSSDSERPMSEEGQQSIKKLGLHLMNQSEQVSQIWHSQLLRAKQTAEILGKYLSPSEGLMQKAHLTPESDPLAMRTRLESEDEPLLIVSHLPFLEYLANLLVTGHLESEDILFQPGGAVKLSRNTHHWKLIWTLAPDQL